MVEVEHAAFIHEPLKPRREKGSGAKSQVALT